MGTAVQRAAALASAQGAYLCSQGSVAPSSDRCVVLTTQDPSQGQRPGLLAHLGELSRGQNSVTIGVADREELLHVIDDHFGGNGGQRRKRRHFECLMEAMHCIRRVCSGLVRRRGAICGPRFHYSSGRCWVCCNRKESEHCSQCAADGRYVVVSVVLSNT